MVQRGDIWLINLDPTIGAEIKKTRPVVIISNDIANQCSPMITVLPVTERGDKVFPFEAEIPDKVAGLTKNSKIKCQQIRSLDKARLVRFLGVLPDPIILAVERALCLHLGLDPAVLS
ncbi:MAG: type II toxin-antitoxin system PemK/MazF family toxin [Candidatus Omnitrophica bacterium]|nr:type II toxin-antitoxin system PemK/MazF family toxin [Candidatus Omnitrophota bacterium]